jgi:LysM repeat protein
MSDAQQALSDPYCVKHGDTLSGIAKRCGQTVSTLQRRNGLRDPRRLAVGQTLYLSDESAFGFSVLFLDALRHPIQNLPFKLEFDGQTILGKTGESGLIARRTTESAKSQVRIWVQEADSSWQQVSQTLSDYGHKLITLVSNAVVLPGRTDLLPHGVEAKPQASTKPATQSTTRGNAQPPRPKPTTGQASKNNPAVKTQKVKGPKGEPVLKIEVDIPQGLLDLFAAYMGAAITEHDWRMAAESLQCETAVLKAFADVESGGHSSFWRLNKADGAHIPALLFERHRFSRETKHKYDKTHPDISWPEPYRKQSLLGTTDKKMSDGTVGANDIYHADYASAYLRLINAYQLDANAALASCSWGKFQIMGDNFALCGTKQVDEFVQLVCQSEFEQIKLVVEFIRRKPATWKDIHHKELGKYPSLWESAKAKDWPMIAFNYNGSGYKTFSYDTKLKAAYEKHKALEKSST